MIQILNIHIFQPLKCLNKRAIDYKELVLNTYPYYLYQIDVLVAFFLNIIAHF